MTELYKELTSEITPIEARNMLWEKGILLFKLDVNQLELVNSYLNAKTKTIVWSCSRRLGKSYTLCVIAIEKCLQKKNAIVKFLASTQKDVKTIIRPLMRELIADAPDEIRPIEKKSEGVWYFPSTGSQIQIAGCDGGRADSVRGSNSDLCIIDEAGFVDDLDYIIKSILIPTTLMTKGKIILASTPPKTATHEFITFLNQAKLDGSFIRKTIFDNPRLTKQEIIDIGNETGGMDSVSFRREYLAEIIKDDELAIIPEFDEELKAKIVKEWKKPPFYDTYEAMDVGMKDLTVVLFGYVDFKANKLIIEDEYVINGKEFTTQKLASEIKKKEQDNFSDPFSGEVKDPYMRVSDNNLILINDLHQLHGMTFYPTRKDDADTALNNVRIMLANQQIIINPRCTTLITHLESGIWTKNKKTFSRSGTKYGHFDAIDSLKYMVRNVDLNKNPFPSGYNIPFGKDAFYKGGNPHNKSAKTESIKRILNFRQKS